MSKTFKPMLADTATDLSKLKFPLLVSPKLDGIRAIVIDGVLMSRSLKPIPNRYVQHLFSRLPDGTDGELILGNPTEDPYRATVSAVMSEDGEPDVKFHVFDNFKLAGGFQVRFEFVSKTLEYRTKNVILVPHTLVRDSKELKTVESAYVTLGFEGTMVRSIDGPYKYGRATEKQGYLLKIKRFVDSEAEILSCYELMHNDNEATTNALGRTERSSKKEGMVGTETLGGFNVHDVKSGVEFSIGSGFTALERESYWSRRKNIVGMFVKYKYFPTGGKDKPRFPIFLGLRDKRDL